MENDIRELERNPNDNKLYREVLSKWINDFSNTSMQLRDVEMIKEIAKRALKVGVIKNDAVLSSLAKEIRRVFGVVAPKISNRVTERVHNNSGSVPNLQPSQRSTTASQYAIEQPSCSRRRSEEPRSRSSSMSNKKRGRPATKKQSSRPKKQMTAKQLESLQKARNAKLQKNKWLTEIGTVTRPKKIDFFKRGDKCYNIEGYKRRCPNKTHNTSGHEYHFKKLRITPGTRSAFVSRENKKYLNGSDPTTYGFIVQYLQKTRSLHGGTDVRGMINLMRQKGTQKFYQLFNEPYRSWARTHATREEALKAIKQVAQRKQTIYYHRQ